MKRMYRQSESSPEDKARLQALRDHWQATRPSLEELVASGEYTAPLKHGSTLDAMPLAALLKQARQEAHLTLVEVATRCGLDPMALLQLEQGVYEQTTLTTLSHLAHAYGKRLVIQLVDEA